MAYIDQFEQEFKQNLSQQRLEISLITDDRIKKSLVKDNIESHIISALTLGAKQFIDTYFFCVLKVIKDNIKIEDLKNESIFNKYKNKFRKRFLDLFEDLDVIFWVNGQSTYWDFNPVTILRTDLLVNTLIEKNNLINQFNSNYSKLESLPSANSSNINEFKVSLELKKDDYENSIFSKKMGENIKINGVIKSNVKGEETKLFCTINGFSDSKKLEIESIPTREEYYKGTGGHNGFLMYEANLFKPIIEDKIFNYLKETLKINIIRADIKIKIENDLFKDKSITDNKDLEYKLIIVNPKDDEKNIKGVIRIKKTLKTLGVKYDLNSSSYIFGYNDDRIDYNKDIKDLTIKFEKIPFQAPLNDQYKIVDDIEEYENLLLDIIKNLEKSFQNKFNKIIKLKIVRDESELKNEKTPSSEIKNESKEELIAEYSIKISGEGSVESKEQPIGIFKIGTKGRIVEAINKKVSISGSEYLKKTHDDILNLQKSFQKTKKIRIDGIVGDETWVPVFGYDRTLVNGSIKIYSDGINPYCVSTLNISDKKIELNSNNKTTSKTTETPKEDPSMIELNLVPGPNYSEEEKVFLDSLPPAKIKPIAKIIIIKNDNLKSGYGKIENLKGNAIVQFNTPFEDTTIKKLTDDVIKGLQQKLDASYYNFAKIESKEVITNDVNTDNLNNKKEVVTDVDKLSTNALIELENECLNQGIKTFLTKVEKPIEIILKGDGNFTIFVESPKNDNTSKITGEINFIITNSAITGMCEILGLPSNYTNPTTKLVITTSEYMYSTSQTTNTPENRIKLGNEALVYFQNKIKVDYDLDIKLALKDKFAEKLEEDSTPNNPILNTKYSEMDGEWIFNVEKENIFYSKDFGDLKIIGDANIIERKIPEELGEEYTEDPYSGESELDNTDQYIKNQTELLNQLTFEIAFDNKKYIEKEKVMNKKNPSNTVIDTNPGEAPTVQVNTSAITPVGKFKLFGGWGSERIINLIFKGESGSKLGIFNYYKPKLTASTKAMMDKVRIDNMTLRELYKYQKTEVHPEVGALICASGLFQFMPSTLEENIRKHKISWDSKFDYEGQMNLGKNMVYAHAGKYIKGENSGTRQDLETAVQSIGNVWASLPVINAIYPKKVKIPGNYGDVSTGGGNRGCYGGDGVNPSSVHVEVGTVVINMIKARMEVSGKPPSYIPDYAKNI